jgi:hypothetical protein
VQGKPLGREVLDQAAGLGAEAGAAGAAGVGAAAVAAKGVVKAAGVIGLGALKKTPATAKPGPHFPERPLPRDPHGNPTPDPEAAGRPHTQLGQKEGRRGQYDQAREFDASGKPVRDIDFTDHGRKNHPNPHQHQYSPNGTGGTPSRGPTEPLKN